MSPGNLSKTPPSSPCSPPRKKAKFSLRLKGKSKLKKDDAEDDASTEKGSFYPMFRSPVQESEGVKDQDCMEVVPCLPSISHPGLLNRANTCYANAVLQVLRRCRGFERFVGHLAMDIKTMGDTTKNNIQPKEIIVTHLSKLLSQMDAFEVDFLNDKEDCHHLRNKGPNLVLAAEPDDFMTAFRVLYPGFECNLQHDAQEFLCSLIASLQESADDIKKHHDNNLSPLKSKTSSNSTSVCNYGDVASCQDPSFIKTLFQGKLVHQTKCMNCEESKLRYEDIQEISVPVVEDQPYLDARKKLMLSPTPKKKKDHARTLQWAISQFASSECLQGDNKYFCENCNTYCEAEIRTCFDELPSVLTVHLKRFASAIGLSSKITSNLKTPLTLSVQEWCSKKCQFENNVYELFGIVLHSGMTSGSGHYETYVRIPKPKNVTQNGDLDTEDATTLNQDNGINGLPSQAENADCNLPSRIAKDDVKVDINRNHADKMEGNISDSNDSKKISKRMKRTRKAKKSVGYTESGSSMDTSEEETKQNDQENAIYTEDMKSPLKSEGNPSCISLITKYFHRSKKSTPKTSTSEDCAKPSENEKRPVVNIPNGEICNDSAPKEVPERTEAELKKEPNPKGCRTIEDCFTKISNSDKKSSKSATIRKLDFMNGSGDKNDDNEVTHQEDKENVNSLDIRNHHPEQLAMDWIHFDDCTVDSVAKKDIIDVLSASESSFMSPYLLFYQKSDIAQ